LSASAGERAAPGPVYAFFDVEETILAFKSMFSFQEYWYQRQADLSCAPQAERDLFQATMQSLAGSGVPREEVNRRYYEFYAGRNADEVAACARSWFKERVSGVPSSYRRIVTDTLKRHQHDGVRPVFVSGSLLEILQPLAEEMKVADLLCTRLEITGGMFTGRILPPQTIGTGKATAVRAFIHAKGADPAHCHAYGDDISDAVMLESVGHPHAVAGSVLLEHHARERGWDVLG
jgi:HAD superfamily hydrolase (TIGR01490 family)